MNKMRFQTQKPKVHRRWFFEKGQSAVELAIVAPVMALLLVVIADFARVFFVSVAVNNAARAGAQFGSQTVANAANPTGMQQAACNDYGIGVLATCQTVLKPAVSQCTCENPPGSVPQCPNGNGHDYCKHTDTATYVTVNTSATFHTILTYPGVPSTIALTGQAIMQVQEN
jgi:Flp pilus assembly protein TadG